MDVLDRQTHLRIVRTMERGRAVSMAFHEINPVYGRQPLQILQAETQRTIDHAMDREAMLLGIDVGQVGGMSLHEVQ